MKNIIEKLEQKRLEFEREKYLILEMVNETNISEMSSEMQSLDSRITMIDEIVFLIENEIWEDELPIHIISNI